MFANAVILNQMLLIRDQRFHFFFSTYTSLINDFFALPEFVDPASGHGSFGDGNSKVIASVLFVILRNMFFIDHSERLEIFPVPEEKWFNTGGRMKIDKAPSRFGLISFSMEINEKEIKIAFTELPKYIPSDIQINLPFETKVIESDDFILKKKVNNSYFINGWPSFVRFQISKPTL